MNGIKLDLRKFKHLDSDDKSTTLQHPDGHSITLAHHALSPEAQKQLMQLAKASQTPVDKSEETADKTPRKMADGGDVDEYGYPKKNSTPKADPTPKPKNEFKDNGTGVQDTSGYDKKANGGEVKMMADGGDEAPEGVPTELPLKVPVSPTGDMDTSLSGMADQAVMPPTPQESQYDINKKVKDAVAIDRGMGETVKELGYPEMATDPATSEKNALIDIINQQDDKKAIEAQKVNDRSQMDVLRQKAGLPPLIPNTPDVGVDPNGQPAIQPSAASSDGTTASQDAESIMRSGYQNQMTGIEQGAKAQGELGEARNQVLQQQEQQQQAAQGAYDSHYQQLEQERQAHIQDIKDGYIDPNKYWTGDKDGNGGHSKIATAIGMILAGFNPTSNPNAAVNMLQFQMNKNLEAQTQNLGAKQNLLGANLRQFGNIRDAMDMTRLMQHDIMNNELDQAAAKATTPMAKAAAMQAKGQLQMQYAPLQQQFAMRRAMMSLAQSGDTGGAEKMLPMLRVLAPEQAKEMETRIVPNVGMATVPVPNEARQQIISSKNVNDLMNMSLQFSKAHAGTLSPSLRAQAATIHNQLVGSIKQAQHDGVYKPSEAEFLMTQIGGSPASMVANFSSVPKIQELQSIKQHEYANLLNTYGIKGKALPQAQNQIPVQYQAIAKWAQDPKNANNPKAQQALKKLGLGQ